MDAPTTTETTAETALTARMPSIGKVIPAAYPAIMALKAATETGGVPAEILELMHLRASQINGCASCVDAGSRSARRAGVSDARLAAVTAWEALAPLHRGRAGRARPRRGGHAAERPAGPRPGHHLGRGSAALRRAGAGGAPALDRHDEPVQPYQRRDGAGRRRVVTAARA